MILRKLIQITGGGGILLAALLLVVSGCGSGPSSLLGPDAGNLSFSALSLSEEGTITPATRRIQESGRISAVAGGDVVVSGTITHGKGKVKSAINYEYRLHFPPGALDEDTNISMTVADRGKVRLTLNPHGIQFNVPVTLSLTIRSSEENLNHLHKLVDIYWLNEEVSGDGAWVPLGADVNIDGATLTASVDLNHFSQYSLGGHGPIQRALSILN